MGGRQAVRPRTLDPVSKVRILPAQPVLRLRLEIRDVANTMAPFWFNDFSPRTAPNFIGES